MGATVCCFGNATGALETRRLSLSNVEVTDDVSGRVSELVREAAQSAIDRRGAFCLAIAGGSLVKILGGMARLPGIKWEKWYVAWVDERCVPHADRESNYGGAHEAWLSKVPIPQKNIFAIDEKLTPGGGGIDVAKQAAQDYEGRLRELPKAVLPRHDGKNGLPSFDLLLLGFGPDGHICSLFPEHPLLSDRSGRWILPIGDSPKPPPERITLSLPAVNAASQVMVVGTGDGKADIVRQVFDADKACSLPCARAWGTSPQGPTWVLDKAAASFLPESLNKVA